MFQFHFSVFYNVKSPILISFEYKGTFLVFLSKYLGISRSENWVIIKKFQ